MAELPKRKHPRLKAYDYSLNARYFITICTYEKQKLLSEIRVGRGLAPAETVLTEAGKIVENTLLDLTSRFRNLVIENYVIMPNHVHVIFALNAPDDICEPYSGNASAGASPRPTLDCNAAAGASPRPTVMDIVCAFKSFCTRECNKKRLIGSRLWQDSFYDHVIRNEADYKNIWEYIDNNPARWAEDKYYV